MNVRKDDVAPASEPDDDNDNGESEDEGVFDGLTALDVIDGELVPRTSRRR